MSSSAPPAVEFWFEFGSNYSYLTVMRIEDLVRRAGLRLAWKPFLLGPIFRELGFTVALGPEAEHEWYNFGALNFPADHPAMDMHDTLYLGEGQVLRTHTSPVQVRTMQAYAPPIRVLAPGNVYRRDFFDATHAPVFSQLEGLAIDEGISFASPSSCEKTGACVASKKSRRYTFPGASTRIGGA